MKYRYLYQNKNNENLTGEINARDRADAYMRLRKMGIRPYRVIGNDPFNWQPWAFWAAIAIAAGSIAVAAFSLTISGNNSPRKRVSLSSEAAELFRERAREAVLRAPDAFRYNVWKGVNTRLQEYGLEPLPKPEGLKEEDAFEQLGN